MLSYFPSEPLVISSLSNMKSLPFKPEWIYIQECVKSSAAYLYSAYIFISHLM